jgi:hypothetical protein
MATTESERSGSRASKGATEEELREALTHVGELMQLPPKIPGVLEAEAKATKAAKAAKAFSLPSTKGTKFWLPIIAAVLAVGVAAATFWPAAPATVPKALQRDWATLNPKYMKNRIAFTDKEVLLTAASGTTTSHRIANIATELKGDSMMIVINYEDQGGLTELSAALVSVPTPKLVFARPQGLVWEAVVR